jgi:hypothetical protein
MGAWTATEKNHKLKFLDYISPTPGENTKTDKKKIPQ